MSVTGVSLKGPSSDGSVCPPSLSESSVHEGSNDNDGSICGSDSAFYKQSEGER